MALPLCGCLILVVEDEPIIALDIADAFEQVGAKAVTSFSLSEALGLVETDLWSAAVVDHRLRDGESSPLCERLTECDIPFVVYSGSADLGGACAEGEQVIKPANTGSLVQKIVSLIGHHPGSSSMGY
jgi:DNA-binding response OmpR family regulator